MRPVRTDKLDVAVDAIIDRVGPDIVCATPLALGKPVQLLNALYGRVKERPDIRLDIVTALSLAVPRAGSELEKRFLEPFAQRVFEDVPELDYLKDLTKGDMPEHIRLVEFYFRPGAMLHVPAAQQNYISSNYTHVVRDLMDRGGNAIIVMVSERGGRYSLSSNPDLTLDAVAAMRRKHANSIVVAMVNRNMPFMQHDAEVGPEYFDVIVDSPEFETPLFGVPNSPAAPADHAVGLYAASLVKDGGTLQLGIGSLGDCVAHWLRARQTAPQDFERFANALSLSRYEQLLTRYGSSSGFEKGLFAASEMFTWSLMCLFEAGVLKRRCYENESLQYALNEGVVGERLADDALEKLRDAGCIQDPLREEEIQWLMQFGLLTETPAAGTNIADIPAGQRGRELKNGQVLHGAFFLGPRDFYEKLRSLPEDQRRLFNMMAVSKVNDLFGEEALERKQRLHARFINVCMKVTLSGAAVSDGIEDGRVISGVGGQYNFVAMAHELQDARSVLLLRAARFNGSGVESNIVFNYGHITIPRHLRDIVITEYGIADLRGKTDAEVAAALIMIADSRFQRELIEQAKAAGKLPRDWQLPDSARNNTPGALMEKLRLPWRDGLLPAFPLGTDFDATEQQLVAALGNLKKLSGGWRGKLALAGGVLRASPRPGDRAALERMGLASPSGLRERLYRRLVCHGLRLAEAGRAD